VTATIAGGETTEVAIVGLQEHVHAPTTVAAVGRRAAIVVARPIVIETVGGARAPVEVASRTATGGGATIEIVDRAAPVGDSKSAIGIVAATRTDAPVALAAAAVGDGTRTEIVGRPAPVVAVAAVVAGKTEASVGVVRPPGPTIGRRVTSAEPVAAGGKRKSVSVM
jgi:hypothetical protein